MTMRTAVWLPAILAAGTALGAPTKSVRVTTYQELAEGQASGVLLSSQGEARSGFAASRLALPTPGDDSVRAMVTASDGTTYMGTGGETPSVLVYRQGKLQKLAKLDAATWVTALCLLDEGKGGQGQLLAATAQDGRIFRVGPDGKSEVVAQVEGEHVWALVRDGKRGVTYVATGPGALWAIADADLAPGTKKLSRARKLFASDARQFLSLERGDDGALYAGTADDAVLYRIDPDRQGDGARAVHDFAGNEIRAIAHYKDAIFVAVNDMQRGDTSSRGTKIVTPAAGTAPGVKAAPATGVAAPSNPSPTEKKGKGALYRIDASGRVEQLHAVVDGFFNVLTVDAEGNLFAAASTPGGRGRLYWVAPPTGSASQSTVYTALEVKESDVLTVAGAGPGAAKERLIGTGNSGAVYALRDQAPTDATYTSKAFSVGAPSRWGSLRFQGQLGAGGGLRLETRSGNLTKPDGSWSPWQPLINPARQPATDEQAGRIASPAGRYLQVRALFSGQAVLRDFTFYYQPLNQRSRLTEVLIGEDASGRVARGARPSATGVGTGPSSLRLRSPVVKLRWKVENPDEDELSYRVFVRRVGTPVPAASPAAPPDAEPGQGWLRLGGAEPLVRTELEWNTETVADGLYELKVVVSDERSNPPEQVLLTEHITPPFLVDNRRPEVRDLAWNASVGTLSGRATDAMAVIAELSYSVDGGDFYPVGPRDGVLDDLSEDFAVRLPRLQPGLHTVLVRATDAADNSATGQLLIQVK